MSIMDKINIFTDFESILENPQVIIFDYFKHYEKGKLILYKLHDLPYSNKCRIWGRAQTNDKQPIHDVFSSRIYNPFSLDFNIRQDWIVVDIGAHIGAFSVMAASKGAQVIAYEPSESNIELLTRNKIENKTNITINECAIGGKAGTMTLYTNPDLPTGNTLNHKEGYENSEEVHVRAFKDEMEKILALHGRIDFLKIDCEGSEYDFYKDIRHLPNIQRIAMEYHKSEVLLTAELQEAGYKTKLGAGNMLYAWRD